MQFSPTIQTKIKIGQPNDRYEQEADAMADKVMSMSSMEAPIQRKCEECKEETMQMKPHSSSISSVAEMKPMARQEEVVQAKSDDREGKSASASLSSQLGQTKGGGIGLSESTNQQMSSAFGTDFSDVNIHTGSEAIQMNRSLNARAFTNGSDIYFNQGEFSPGSGEGKRLLAHELTHVVQQGGMNNTVQRAPKCGTSWATMIRTDNGNEAVFTDKDGANAYAKGVKDEGIKVRVSPSGENWKVECISAGNQQETEVKKEESPKKEEEKVATPKEVKEAPKAKEEVAIIKIYLVDGVQRIEVEKGGKVVFSGKSSVGSPIKEFLKEKKADGTEGSLEYREYKSGGKQKLSGKGLRFFINVDGYGYGVHSRIQKATERNGYDEDHVLNANGSWDSGGGGCARLEDDKAKELYNLVGKKPLIRYYQEPQKKEKEK